MIDTHAPMPIPWIGVRLDWIDRTMGIPCIVWIKARRNACEAASLETAMTSAAKCVGVTSAVGGRSRALWVGDSGRPASTTHAHLLLPFGFWAGRREARRDPLCTSQGTDFWGTPSDTQPNPFGSEESIESKKDPTRGCWRPDLLGHRGRLKLLQASLELDAAGGRWPEAARAKQWPSTCRDFKQTRGDPVRGWQGPHTEPSRRLWAENL